MEAWRQEREKPQQDIHVPIGLGGREGKKTRGLEDRFLESLGNIWDAGLSLLTNHLLLSGPLTPWWTHIKP